MLTGRVRLSGAATCVVAIVIGMTGCFASTPDPTPSRSAAPSAPPLFASDEEALAAATEAYTAYLAVADSVGEDGGADVERLSAHVTEPYFEEQRASYSSLMADGVKTRGGTTFDPPLLQEFDPPSRTVSIYVCANVSAVRVIDLAGVDVTPLHRSDIYPLVVALEARDSHSSLLVDSSQTWTGENFCEK